jgi:hypothetical protein
MKTTIIWLLAIIITLAAAIYQRRTGPTHPKRVSCAVNGQQYSFKLTRSGNSDCNALVNMPVADTSVTACVLYKIYKSTGNYDTIHATRNGTMLTAELPKQPSAGKLQYYIEFKCKGNVQPLLAESPVVIRFKNPVPAGVLVPHILLMFLTMLFSATAGLYGLFNSPQTKKWALVTIVCLFVGGFILGPLVQKYAFGEYWTGFPFGFDLTDNKTLIAFLGWLLTFGLMLKTNNKRWAVLGMIVTLGIFSIPHSMWGSERNYETGTVETGRN